MNIPLNTQNNEQDNSPPTYSKCLICPDVFPTEELTQNHDGPVATFSNDQYCTFSCVTQTPEDSSDVS